VRRYDPRIHNDVKWNRSPLPLGRLRWGEFLVVFLPVLDDCLQQGNTHLRGRKPNTGRIVHRVAHVFNQFLCFRA